MDFFSVRGGDVLYPKDGALWSWLQMRRGGRGAHFMLAILFWKGHPFGPGHAEPTR